MSKHVIIFTDGGSRGNPGPAAAGYVIKDSSGASLSVKGVYLGTNTNNFAEYTGLIRALQDAVLLEASSVEVYSDSQLMIRQLNGEYKVKSPNIKPLYQQCTELLGKFKKWQVDHVYRNDNKKADEMVNKSLDAKADVDETPIAATNQKKPIRLGIMLSGGGTTMVNIQDEIDTGKINAEIGLVISSRSQVKGNDRARAIGLEPVVIRKKDYDDIDSFSDRIAETLRENDIDLVIQAGWLCLWKIPDDFENRVMNIHPSLLPSFGGQGMWGHHVHEAVLKAGCKISGCTVHFCTNEYDKGPIIVQLSCPAYDSDTPDTLAARVFEQECKAYPEAIRLYEAGKIQVQGNIVEIH